MRSSVLQGTVLSKRAPEGHLEFSVVKRGKGDGAATHRVCEACSRLLEADDFGPDPAELCWRCELAAQEERNSPSTEDEWVVRKTASYKEYAAKQGYCYALTDTQCALLFQQPCTFCGAAGPRNGLCRLNPESYVYELDNVLTACHRCAFMKLNHGYGVFVRICRTIAAYKGLVAQPYWHPECFANSPSHKSFKHYANLGRRVMVLDKPTFQALLKNDCFYCGKKNEEGVHQNGVDRIDSRNRKYELGNVVACCKTCNTLKWCVDQQEFLRHVARIATHAQLDWPQGANPLTAGSSADDPIVL